MKSLFLRLLVSLWLAMALVGGIFAAIHAATFPKEGGPRWRAMVNRSLQLRATQAIDCAHEGGTDCATALGPLDERDQRVTVFKDGVPFVGEPIEGAEPIIRAAEGAGGPVTRIEGEVDLTGVVIDRGEHGRYVAVATMARPSRWMFFVTPETLPFRLAAIVIVTGFVSVLLARYLSRPIRTLRGAAQRLAKGDLDVRVSGDIAGADGETRALGEDMDRMAERIQELLESQKRLLRDVSHELRSPLARLNLALELVRRQSPDQAQPTLDRIEREAERLAQMIDELLTLSRLESGVAIERPERVDLSELVSDVAADVAFEAEQKDVKIDAKVEPALGVAGDAELLRRAIENVLRNALRFTDGGSAVHVALEKANSGLSLVVRDHGPGVPDDALGAIFQPFYRVSDDRARKTGGVGIGLAITHAAVAAHGGTVAAENAKGGGLVVSISLPAAA